MVAAHADLKRYELFGWDYESHSPLAEEALAWYRLWARRTGGPLLALACGTGRLLCRLATAGSEVVGLDLSDGMLALARKNIAALPGQAQDRIRLVKADMSGFDLGRQFGLILIADNSFRELSTRKEMVACLRCVRRHLKPGGRALITERRFNPALYSSGRRVFGWSDPQPHPGTGELVSRRGEVRLSKDRKRICSNFFYRTVHSDGNETIDVCPQSGPLLQKHEYLELLARAGFHARIFDGYKEIEDAGVEPVICFVCEAKRREGRRGLDATR